MGNRGLGAVRGKQEILQVGDDVLAVAVDGHGVAVGQHVLPHCLRLIDLLAQLIVVADCQVGAVTHRAGVRRQIAQQQIEQGSLAAAVRPDDPDLVPPGDDGAEVLDQGLIVIAVSEPLRLNYQVAGLLRLRQLHRRAARSLAALPAGLAHLLQGAHPPLIAGAPGLDALADPDLLLG